MLSDLEILHLLAHRPEKALEQLMDKYMGFVYTIVYGRLGMFGREDVEECVSDVFYELYKTRSSIDLGKGSIKAYLAVISKRKAIDRYRRHKNDGLLLSLDNCAGDPPSGDTRVEEEVAGGETADRLITEIRALGDPDSQIMIRKYYFGQSTKIIAGALGIKENTVDKKVSRALIKLRQALEGVF